MKLLRLLLWDLPRVLVGDFVLGSCDDLRVILRELRDDVRSVIYGDLP